MHHSSEDYNLAVALRQGTFQGLFSWVFYLPLALVGFPPAWFAAVSSFDTLYQFWIHTRVIGNLGPLEWVFNTPSHHRVHHARNPKYLDKNYAGTLIIWDRMFGTFQAEEEEPVYGLTKPLNSWNPLWANLHVWNDLFRDAWLAPRWSDKIRIWFMPPGWRPEGLPPNPGPPEVTRQNVVAYNTTLPRALNTYALAQFVAALLLAFGLMAAGKSLARGEVIVAAVLVLWALLNIGGIFEHRRWALISELLRIPVTAALFAVRLPDGSSFLAVQAGLAMAVVALWLFLLIYRYYFDSAPQLPSRIIGVYPTPNAEVAESRPEVATTSMGSPSLDVENGRGGGRGGAAVGRGVGGKGGTGLALVLGANEGSWWDGGLSVSWCCLLRGPSSTRAGRAVRTTYVAGRSDRTKRPGARQSGGQSLSGAR